MARKPKSYDNEILNMRAFYLRLLGKLWIILLSAAAGALLFGFGYYIRREAPLILDDVSLSFWILIQPYLR